MPMSAIAGFLMNFLLLLSMVFNIIVGSESANNCFKGNGIISGKNQDDVWTEWMGFQIPTSNTYYHDLIKNYPRCKEALKDITKEHQSKYQYRIKYVADEVDNATANAQAAAAGNRPLTMSFTEDRGIICNNDEDSCSNYEIRFRCGANVPIADYHWDLSGKTSYNAVDYHTCSNSPNPYIYPLRGNRAGHVNGDLFLVDSYPESDTRCAVFFNGSTEIEFDDFNGTCVSQPSRCSNGFSVSLWMTSKTANTGPILRSLGTDPSDDHSTNGVYIGSENGFLKMAMQLCDINTQVSLEDPMPSGWFHLVTTFHPLNSSRIEVYIDGNQMGTITQIRAISTAEAPVLISGSNNGSDENGTRRVGYGLSNMKIFNRQLSLDEVRRLHDDDANPSFLEVLQLQDVSTDPTQIDLQCIVKTCAIYPTIHWLYYPNISALLTSNLTTLRGSSERKNKCQLEYRLQVDYKTGVYACEPRVGDSYAYKVIKIDSSRESNDGETPSSFKETMASIDDIFTTAAMAEETSGEDSKPSNGDKPERDHMPVKSDKNPKENSLENIEEISNFILRMPASSQENVVKELNIFSRVDLELLSIEEVEMDTFDYQFEHKLPGKHASREMKDSRQTESRRLIGSIRLPFTATKLGKSAEDITLAIAYGRPGKAQEYQVNVTSSGEHIEGTVDDGILFMWVFIANKEVSVYTNFSVEHKKIQRKPGERRHCAFWDDALRMWSTKGCQTITDFNSVDHGRVTCACNHTTSFAVILQVVDFQVPTWMKMLSKILGSISICCLMITICIFVLLHPAKNYRIIIHGNLAAALCGAQLVFMTTSDGTKYPSLCQVGAVASHYLFTVFLSWMLIEGYLLYLKTATPTRKAPRLKAVIFFGWGLPLILVGSSFALKKDAYSAIYSCWINSEILQWAFVAQASLVVLINTMVLIIVMKKFASLKVNVNKNEFERTKAHARALCAVLPVLGLTWVFGILAIDTSVTISTRTIVFMLLFDITNCLQILWWSQTSIVVVFYGITNPLLVSPKTLTARTKEKNQSTNDAFPVTILTFLGVFILTFHCLRNREIQKEYDIRKKAHRSRRSSRSYSSSNQILRCRTTAGELLYVPCDQDEKSERNESSSPSAQRSTKLTDSMSF